MRELTTRGLSLSPKTVCTNGNHTATCSDGYITVRSPQGTRVCTGTISYTDPRIRDIPEYEVVMFQALGWGQLIGTITVDGARSQQFIAH